MELLCSEYAETAAGVLLLVLLGILSVQDLRWQAIGLQLPACVAAAGVIWLVGRACAEGTTAGRIVLELVLALLPGVFFWLVAVATSQMGYGDGLVLVAVGLWCGLWKCLFAVGISLFLMALFSVGILILRRAHRSTRIPYLPFLTAGYLLQTVIGISAKWG